ncbi:aliphatic sulfonate ABC transporter substrate-binding protein [Beijerinckia sp. L45]|uniref:aliphatic sulfonate ABC transporter substrate-binding protein n=1 Tax=Beijerinckia sp. L45 TaxID=1641855 RepID=UPI00131DEFDF|nr:aliphatic sulfonate ABC transporter substrate-binding protein [Beijerinckia sp. L45]
MNRRDLLTLAGASGALAAVPFARQALSRPNDRPADLPSEIRIGYQKSSLLAIAKQQKLLEARFDASVAVRWVEFAYGPPLLEALGAGRLDYGYTGNAPPIFAQAARAPILYVAVQPAHGGNVAIVVPQDSSLRSLRDLKGKTVGVAKGSSAHDLLVAALDSVHLSYNDIKPVYLVPADAASAFATGAIDAWSIWDPFLAIAEVTRKARHLPLEAGVDEQNAFFLAHRDFCITYPHVVAGINSEMAAAALYARSHRDEATRLFAAATGVAIDAETLAIARTEFDVVPVSETILQRQQGVADRFARIKLIPAPIRVADLAWTWAPGG